MVGEVMTNRRALIVLAVAIAGLAALAAVGVAGVRGKPACPDTPDTMAGLSATVDCELDTVTGNR